MNPAQEFVDRFETAGGKLRVVAGDHLLVENSEIAEPFLNLLDGHEAEVRQLISARQTTTANPTGKTGLSPVLSVEWRAYILAGLRRD
jgi:hypothetical protein